jgi:enamine deaminase RidA (YjgF/YER057c/UK114 family)
MQILQPPQWKRPKGYANGVLSRGTVIHLAGQVGWNEHEHLVSENFAVQVEQALTNIVAILGEADAGPQHLTRMTWFVVARDEYLAQQAEIGAAYRRVIGRHFPAMSVIGIAGLIEKGAKVEIEATAIIPD